MADEWLTLDEAAAYLKLSKPSIYRLCTEGRLPFYKIAGTGQRRFKRADLDALLEPGELEEQRPWLQGGAAAGTPAAAASR